MSYDLFFKPRNGSFDQEQFVKFFRSRRYYKVDPPQAFYQNEDTGVYFSFEIQEHDPESAEEHFPVMFNMNFFRPSYFVLEAEPEVTAFVESLDLLVSDPQTHGMGEGEYESQLLVSGWSYGNEFGYSAVLKNPENCRDVSSLPTDTLVQTWKWNCERNALQANIGESKFVPRVLYIRLEGKTVTAAVWPDGIPIVIPPVDYLIVPRKQLAPRRLFKKIEDRTLLAWENALPLFERHSSQKDGTAIALDYDKPPKDVVKFVESLSSDNREVVRLSADAVLDQELVQKYKG